VDGQPNAIDMIFSIPAYPFWALVIIAADVVALWDCDAVTGNGRVSRPASGLRPRDDDQWSRIGSDDLNALPPASQPAVTEATGHVEQERAQEGRDEDHQEDVYKTDVLGEIVVDMRPCSTAKTIVAKLSSRRINRLRYWPVRRYPVTGGTQLNPRSPLTVGHQLLRALRQPATSQAPGTCRR
jgi:hypothetical protein